MVRCCLRRDGRLVFEVYDPATLQSTIGKLVDSFNREAASASASSSRMGSLQLTQQQIGSQTYYTLRNSKQANFEIDYTYEDSYLIVGPDIATLSQAIRDRQSGNTLTHSQTFQALAAERRIHEFLGDLLPQHRPVVGPLVDQIKAVGTLTAQQQQSIATLQANTAPGLIYVYGEPRADRGGKRHWLHGLRPRYSDDAGAGRWPFPPQMFLGASERRMSIQSTASTQ